jgi:hypothetical protein
MGFFAAIIFALVAINGCGTTDKLVERDYSVERDYTASADQKGAWE